MIYEFITPSDPITFKAQSDKIAFFVALIVGNAKAGIERADGKEVELSSMFFIHPDPIPVIEGYLGCSISEFGDTNATEVGEALKSFCYGEIRERQAFDDACDAITDPEKLQEFKAKHEDKNRTSLSEWVAYAWRLGDKFLKK